MDQESVSWKCKVTLTNLVQFHSWRDTGGARFLLKAPDLVSFGSGSAGEAVSMVYTVHTRSCSLRYGDAFDVSELLK